MRVMDIMTARPITLRPSDTMQQAEEIMDENKIRQLPVVKGTELLGIVTDRDIRSFIGGRLLSAPDEREKAMSTPVTTVMTTKPVTLAPDDGLEEAIELLIEEKFGGIPVVDEEEGLVGILTHVDVLRCFLERLEGE
jgi:CBS domain-containing protein